MDLTSDADLTGWTPIRVGWRDGRPIVDWCHTEGVAFREPFFGETVQRCLSHPFRLLFRHETTIEGVGRHVAEHPGLPPAGFIFHMSRCGSTLVSQMLAAVAEHLVLSEPPPVDAVLRAAEADPGLTDRERVAWLRWIVGALGQGAPGQSRLFVKFDAWSALALPLVRQAFPDVPCVFLFRDPIAVLRSQSRQYGAHVIPGVLPAEPFGLTSEAAAAMPLVEYAARVLGHICGAALALEDDPRVTFADYADLPELVFSDLLPAWSLDLGQRDLDAMAAAGTRNAKNPSIVFDKAEAGRRPPPPPALIAAADRWMMPAFERLRSARTVPGGVGGR
ncbi:MAG TPA: hypothetical protein VF244_08865 [Acidimicrobiales bacterium]